ncbi:beta-casein-like [Marmota flaviventris]|uniref:beta-casein-like n=1 Tax=Marmota flaviventris TaxID=93162 RepID=UPI003A8A1F17
MKVLILACLVALALAREISSSEESITHIKDESQDKIHPIAQPQLPYAQLMPYTLLPQNVLTLSQLAMVLSLLQPEIAEVPQTKETILSKLKLMPFLKSPTELTPFVPQIPHLTDLQNQHLLLPQLQPVVQQVPQVPQFPQAFPQTPILLPQPQVPIPQSKIAPVPQQVVPFPQRDMPVQAFLEYQDLLFQPTRPLYPVTDPLVPVSNPVTIYGIMNKHTNAPMALPSNKILPENK